MRAKFARFLRFHERTLPNLSERRFSGRSTFGACYDPCTMLIEGDAVQAVSEFVFPTNRVP
jgi:hypothetical protein